MWDSNSDGEVGVWSNYALYTITVPDNCTDGPLPFFNIYGQVRQTPTMNSNDGYCTLFNARERHI